MESPIGPLVLAGDGEVLTHIRFHGVGQADWREAPEPFVDAVAQLRAYFAGELTEFDLAFRPQGTPFQQSVWKALVGIPYSETTSYGAIAKAIGKPDAVRAVGAANGANPIPIVIPCHRVIGASGKLTGFGGGLDVKQKLLRLESRQLRML